MSAYTQARSGIFHTDAQSTHVGLVLVDSKSLASPAYTFQKSKPTTINAI